MSVQQCLLRIGQVLEHADGEHHVHALVADRGQRLLDGGLDEVEPGNRLRLLRHVEVYAGAGSDPAGQRAQQRGVVAAADVEHPRRGAERDAALDRPRRQPDAEAVHGRQAALPVRLAALGGGHWPDRLAKICSSSVNAKVWNPSSTRSRPNTLGCEIEDSLKLLEAQSTTSTRLMPTPAAARPSAVKAPRLNEIRRITRSRNAGCRSLPIRASTPTCRTL